MTGSESLPIILIKSIFVCFFIVTAVTGNISVMYVVLRYKSLQTIPHYFIASLALTDLLYALFGCTSMVITTIAQEWVLGLTYCEFIGATNTWFTTSSVWTLVAISVNRFVAVSRPFNINKVFTVKLVSIIITLIWLCAFVISTPPLLGWSEFVPSNEVCVIHTRRHISYCIVLGVTNYIIPALTLTILYFKIYLALRKQNAVRKILMNKKDTESSEGRIRVYSFSDYSPRLIKKYITDKLSKKETGEVFEKTASSNSKNLTSNIENETISANQNSTANSENDSSSNKKNSRPNFLEVPGSHILKHAVTPPPSPTTTRKLEKNKMLIKETRTTKLIAAVVVAFFICWTPLIVAALLFAFEVDTGSFGIVTFSLVVTTMNGVLNPIIYGVMNKKFLNAYKMTFRGICNKICCYKAKK